MRQREEEMPSNLLEYKDELFPQSFDSQTRLRRQPNHFLQWHQRQSREEDLSFQYKSYNHNQPHQIPTSQDRH